MRRCDPVGLGGRWPRARVRGRGRVLQAQLVHPRRGDRGAALPDRQRCVGGDVRGRPHVRRPLHHRGSPSVQGPLLRGARRGCDRVRDRRTRRRPTGRQVRDRARDLLRVVRLRRRVSRGRARNVLARLVLRADRPGVDRGRHGHDARLGPALQADAGGAPRRDLRAGDDDEGAGALARRTGGRRRDRPRAAVPRRYGGLPDSLDRLRDPDPRRHSARCAHDARRAERHRRDDGRLMGAYDRLRGLELVVDDVRTERRSVDVSSDFKRVTTVVVLSGRGVEGRGEDVTYTAGDHDWFPSLDPPGATTLGELSSSLEGLKLFDGEPEMPASRDYRRWAFESAALDLALRQAGASLGEAVDRDHRPVRFVVSTRGDAFAWLSAAPQLELKLDPANEWERSFMERLAATGRVRVLDLKAYYRGTAVDVDPDPELYRNVVELFPDVVIEDASLDDECGDVLRGHEQRLSFDAPIHSVADVRALAVEPRWMNIKPSRFRPVERLRECLDHSHAHGIRLYGGGQFELDVGRRQIQSLASLFYADGPNDVAPGEYNTGAPRAGLPQSPLPPPGAPGF